MFSQLFIPTLSALIADAAYGLVAVAGLYGLVIWAWGRALTRPTLMLLGLCIGGGVGVVIANLTDAGTYSVLWVLLSALAGAGIGFVAYRNLMSLSLGFLLSVMSLWVFTVMMRQAPTAPLQTTKTSVSWVFDGSDDEQLIANIDAQRLNTETSPESGIASLNSITPATGEATAPHKSDDLISRSRQAGIQSLKSWWQWLDQRPHLFKWPALAIAVLGLLAGLWLGSTEPDISAIIGASLLGSMLMTLFWQVTMLLNWQYIPDYPIQDTRQALLIVMGLAVVGFIVQLIFNWNDLKKNKKHKKEKQVKGASGDDSALMETL